MTTIEEATELNEEMIKMDGFDDCVLGICHRYGQPPILAYDFDKVILKLMDDGMTYEEAIEYWDYNQIGAYIGESTPCFVERIKL
jgi:hypothetical protein